MLEPGFMHSNSKCKPCTAKKKEIHLGQNEREDKQWDKEPG